ncbi:MAG: hypothetical protein CR977_00055 [Gammaproteobacteria bacterium]|nr:MAG: hypothetical protein CR977_00055 [Gammaproteobacteria bacterium]
MPTLEELEKKRAKIQEQIRKKKAEITKAERKKDTRKKILLGSLVQEQIKRGEITESDLQEKLDKFLTRKTDRELFNLK